MLGISLGWAAGIAPGPLSALVVLTALRRGFPGGARVALAPLLTDAPIIVLALAVVSNLPAGMVTGLSVAGGAYLVFLGVSELRSAHLATLATPELVGALHDLRRGVLTNLLSPHPWLFWLAVGGPILVTAWARAPVAAVGFLAGFYTLLVGTKLALAAVAAGSRHRLSDRWYRRLVTVGGALLVLLGVLLVAEAAGVITRGG
ncbi:MAG: LysE family transporter [Acidimicrobiia bacterium]